MHVKVRQGWRGECVFDAGGNEQGQSTCPASAWMREVEVETCRSTHSGFPMHFGTDSGSRAALGSHNYAHWVNAGGRACM